MTVLESLIKRLSRLPGVGRKSAARIAYYLLSSDDSFNEELGEDIATLKRRLRPCSVCGSFTESDPCSICTDTGRDRSVVCVVERAQDVTILETSDEYRGLYHVLGGVISPIDGIGPNELRLGSLVERVRSEGVREVILATNPTVEGDTTALYVVKLLEPLRVTVSRLALGLPVGGDLEYADRLTLARSLRARTPIAND